MERPKISIIVPVYNAEKYIATCISSILRQTYTNFELLLIIDGATDGSTEICHELELNDQRIIVVDKKNEGVSATRNHGLCMARGEFVCFVDADDRVTEDYLEQLLNAVTENDAQMALCQYAFERGELIISSGEPELRNYDKNTDSIYDKYVRSLYRIDGTEYILGSACRSIIKRNMLLDNAVIFPLCKLYEDQLFLLGAMAASEKIVAVNKVMYYYNDACIDSAVRRPYKTDLLESQIVYMDCLELCLHKLPITQRERIIIHNYALLNVRKLLLTNAAMNSNAEARKKEIMKIRKSKLFNEQVSLVLYWKWFFAQPLKTGMAELLIQFRMYGLLRKLRSR